MAFRPRKPQKGGNIFKELYRSICEIIDYLPSLEIKGDNKNFKITESRFGRTIEQLNNQHSVSPSQLSNGSSSETAILGKTLGGKMVSLYPNGYEKEPLKSPVRLQVFNISFNASLPADSKVLVYLMNTNIIAGNDIEGE